jgi:hypothetical protein
LESCLLIVFVMASWRQLKVDLVFVLVLSLEQFEYLRDLVWCQISHLDWTLGWVGKKIGIEECFQRHFLAVLAGGSCWSWQKACSAKREGAEVGLGSWQVGLHWTGLRRRWIVWEIGAGEVWRMSVEEVWTVRRRIEGVRGS